MSNLIFHRARAAFLFSIMALVAFSCSTVPAPPERRAQEVTSWDISPAEGYNDEFGYVRLDYTLPGSEPTIPAGGRLTIHLGRQSLEHANTLWYIFTVSEGSATLLRRAGEPGVPNIKGPDGNWWYDIILDLPKQVFREMSVMVEDRKINATYSFTLHKQIRLEECS